MSNRMTLGATTRCWSQVRPPSNERLKAMTDTTDGFEIAERDLELRGPGDFFGTRQAGMPTFRMVDLVRDRQLLDLAQQVNAGTGRVTLKPFTLSRHINLGTEVAVPVG